MIIRCIEMLSMYRIYNVDIIDNVLYCIMSKALLISIIFFHYCFYVYKNCIFGKTWHYR